MEGAMAGKNRWQLHNRRDHPMCECHWWEVALYMDVGMVIGFGIALIGWWTAAPPQEGS
jgi:hypothetical protein